VSWLIRSVGPLVPGGCDLKYQTPETAVEVAYTFLERSIVDEVRISHEMFEDVACTVNKRDSRTPEETLGYLKSALRQRQALPR